MNKCTRAVSITLALLFLSMAFFAVPCSAVSFDHQVKTYSDSILMVNLDTDMEVYAKDADARRYPAALTKIMTFIVAVENLEDLSAKIEIKQSCIDAVLRDGMSCSGLDWHIGEKMSVTDILYALLLPVGHDAAMVLADYIGEGDITRFVRLMNEKAEQLGCADTHFTNPFGVHDAEHYTTARDLYLMSKYAMGLPLFSKICSTATYYMEGDDYPLVTTNLLIDPGRGGDYYYTYATGLKNGTTVQAGRCLVASAVYEGYAYLYIGLHAPYDEDDDDPPQYCMEEAANMFRWAFLNLTFVTPFTKDTPICEQPVDHAWNTESILLVPQSDMNIVLPDDYTDGDITVVPDHTESVSAPIAKGDVITTATVYYKNEPFTTVNLVAHDAVDVSPILYTTDAIRGVLTSPWFLIAVAVVVVLFVMYVSVSSSYAKKKRRSKK